MTHKKIISKIPPLSNTYSFKLSLSIHNSSTCMPTHLSSSLTLSDHLPTILLFILPKTLYIYVNYGGQYYF